MRGSTPPTSLEGRARDNLRFVDRVVGRAVSFSAVPGRGGMAMGMVGLLTAAVAATRETPQQWLLVWLAGAVGACAVGLVAIQIKLRRNAGGLLTVSTIRFATALAPALLAGAVMTTVLVQRGLWELLAGTWLMLYGVGVAAAGATSTVLVTQLGLALIGCGIVALAVPAAADGMMAVGFGGLQILFGALIARRQNGED